MPELRLDVPRAAPPELMKTINSTECPRCGGTGRYAYDHNHTKPCEVCCAHDKGWWLMQNDYGENNGRWACMAGCGEIVDIPPRMAKTFLAALQVKPSPVAEDAQPDPGSSCS